MPSKFFHKTCCGFTLEVGMHFNVDRRFLASLTVSSWRQRLQDMPRAFSRAKHVVAVQRLFVSKPNVTAYDIASKTYIYQMHAFTS